MRVASAFRIPRRSAAGDQWAIGRSLRTAEATRGCHPIHTGAATTAPNRLRQERGRAPWCASRMMAQPRHAQTQSALPAPGPGHTCLQARARARCVPDALTLTTSSPSMLCASASAQAQAKARARACARAHVGSFSASRAPRPLFKTPASHHSSPSMLRSFSSSAQAKAPPARVRARVGSFIDCSARTRRDHSPGRQPPATPAPGARAPRKVCEAQQPSAPHHPSTITYLPHPKAKAWSVHGAPSRASSLTRTSARGVVARLQQKNIQLPPSILTTLVWLLQCAQPM
jgi:hypothetical protein